MSQTTTYDRKVLLYISMSLDGYLAGPGDDLSFLDVANMEGEDYGYQAFTSQVDTYLVGRRTYSVVKEILQGPFPQATDYPACYVITNREMPPEEGVTFYGGDLEALIADIRSKPGKHIYCDGGAEIVKQLLQLDLVDEMTIAVIPVLLGGGTPLFKDGIPHRPLELLGNKTFPTGLVQLHYRVIRDRKD